MPKSEGARATPHGDWRFPPRLVGRDLLHEGPVGVELGDGPTLEAAASIGDEELAADVRNVIGQVTPWEAWDRRSAREGHFGKGTIVNLDAGARDIVGGVEIIQAAAVPEARPVYSAVALLLTTISAEVAPPLEAGFQPSIVPWRVSKMNTAGTLVLPGPGIRKSVVDIVVFETWPVGPDGEPEPTSGIVTVKLTFVAVSVWLTA